MNLTTSSLSSPPVRDPAAAGTPWPASSTLEAMHARFGLRVAARLTERSAELEPDLAERLRFAREKALERSRQVRRVEVRTPLGVTAGGAALLGRGGLGRDGPGRGGWWVKAASLFPALALALGLFMIQRSQENAQISTAAAVDTALLADDLPPQAYSDAGFAEFLKSSNE